MNYDRYIGIPFKTMNCADLALKVQKEVFNKKYDFDYIKPSCDSPFAYSVAIKKNLFDFMESEIKEPYNGCAVLMKCRNRLNHIGTYYEYKKNRYVLHTSEAFGSSVIHKISDLKRLFIDIEGFYKWK